MRGWRGARVGTRRTTCGEHAAWDGQLYTRPAACFPHPQPEGSAAMGQRGRAYAPLPCRLDARVEAWAW